MRTRLGHHMLIASVSAAVVIGAVRLAEAFLHLTRVQLISVLLSVVFLTGFAAVGVGLLWNRGGR